MPWHDVHLRIKGPSARDVACNFIERWNHHKRELNCQHSPYLLPKQVPLSRRGNMKCQILRSIGKWSCGCRDAEHSILEAYRYCIRSAKHFIYIENQYFISDAGGGGIENNISGCLIERISRAISNNENFRCIVILPVHPEGKQCYFYMVQCLKLLD